MPAALAERVGVSIWGRHWKVPMAEELRLPLDIVSAWQAGEGGPSDSDCAKLLKLLFEPKADEGFEE